MSHGEILAENRSESKRYAARRNFGHRLRLMPAKKKEPKSPLQKIFLKRVQEEMDRQGLTRNKLSERVGAPPQTTLNDIMNGADPRLENVHGIAFALGVAAVELLTEKSLSGTVHIMPNYPRISGHADKKSQDVKKRRA